MQGKLSGIKPFLIKLLIIIIISSCTSNKNFEEKSNFGIVIHGGAGTILKENMTEEMEEMYLKVGLKIF